MNLSRVTIVLDKVRHPDNLGSALRAMKNCDLRRLVLADPQTTDFERASVMALDAAELLNQMVLAPNLKDAVAGGTLVAGTTSRKPAGMPAMQLRDFVALASSETEKGGEVVIVFGNEQRGLSDAELDLCQVAVNIPASPAKDSINLAQAVMITAHEFYVESLGFYGKSSDWGKAEENKRQSQLAQQATEPKAEEALANAGTLHALYDLARKVFLEADFLNKQNPEPIMSELKRLIERSRPTQRETELLLTAFKHLARKLSSGLK